MTWARDQRLEFIRAKIAAGETVRRSDLRDKFYISAAACATTFRAFEEKYPDVMRYCKTMKAYVPADFVTPSMDWRARALAAEAALAARPLQGDVQEMVEAAFQEGRESTTGTDRHYASRAWDNSRAKARLAAFQSRQADRA